MTTAHRPTPRLPRLRWRSIVQAGLAFVAMSAAHAAPETAPDAVDRFLIQQGLLDPAPAAPVAPTAAPNAAPTENAFVRQVRDQASDMVLTAMNFLGVRYQRGGSSEERGFDCSGFTRHIFEMSLGRVLPRRADEQAKAPGLLAIRRDELKPGDLVFFNTLRRTFSHVGIYVGDGKFIHAPRPGGEVRVEDMRFPYWNQRFTGARRAESAADVPVLPLITARPALPALR